MRDCLDPKLLDLYCGGDKVDGFRVTGLVAESALQQTLKTNLRSLTPDLLPQAVEFDLDRRGRQMIKVHPEDRERAVDLARHLRLKLHEKSLGVVGAVVKECGGEHDLVLDEITGAMGGPQGFISCELKCRRIYSEAGKTTVRAAHRKELCDESEWWARVVAKKGSAWCGRMICLAVFDRSGNFQQTRADFKPRGGEWRGVWGWLGSTAVLPVRLPLAPPPAAPAPAAGSASRTKARRAPEQQFGSLALTWRFEKNPLHPQQGSKRVAGVTELLAAMGMPRAQLLQPGRTVDKLKRAHGDVSDQDLFEVPRKRAKPGGRKEWVGTQLALKTMHAALARRG